MWLHSPGSLSPSPLITVSQRTRSAVNGQIALARQAAFSASNISSCNADCSTAASLLPVFSPSPSNRCCRCNGRSAKCTRCSCARNSRSCSSCFPASHGRCQNQAAGASSSPSRDEGAPSPAAAHDCPAASATNPAHTITPASELGAASSAITASLNTSALSLPPAARVHVLLPAVNVAATSLAASSSQLPSLSLIATYHPFTLRHVPKGAGNLWFGEVVYATEMHSPQPLRESSLLPILP